MKAKDMVTFGQRDGAQAKVGRQDLISGLCWWCVQRVSVPAPGVGIRDKQDGRQPEVGFDIE